MDLGLSGKTALVTGAGRGLGSRIAAVLASEGATILSVSRSGPHLEESHAALADSGPHAFVALDLEKPESLPLLFAWLDGQERNVDVVINNVGGTLDVSDPFATVDDFMDVMWINLGVAIAINRKLIPGMTARKWGRICHVSSISALENQGPPAYCAAKAATNAYVRSVGRYVAKDNVIVTGIMPGAVLTEGGYWDLASETRPDHVSSFLSERMAIQRFGTELEIADAVAFLVSDLSSFMVGSVLLADGGQGRSFTAEGV